MSKSSCIEYYTKVTKHKRKSHIYLYTNEYKDIELFNVDLNLFLLHKKYLLWELLILWRSDIDQFGILKILCDIYLLYFIYFIYFILF